MHHVYCQHLNIIIKKYIRKQKYMELAEAGISQEGQRPTALVILHVVKRPAIIKIFIIIKSCLAACVCSHSCGQ